MTVLALILALNTNADSLRHGLEVCGDRRPSKAYGWQLTGTCVSRYDYWALVA